MGNLKFAIIGLGVVGLIVLLVMPIFSMGGFSIKLMQVPGGEKFVFLGGFGLAIAMGAVAIKAGLSKGTAGGALVGFAVSAVECRHAFSTGAAAAMKIALACAVLGVVVSGLGLAKGEDKA